MSINVVLNVKVVEGAMSPSLKENTFESIGISAIIEREVKMLMMFQDKMREEREGYECFVRTDHWSLQTASSSWQ